MKAKEFIPASKPRNFVAKNAPTSGAGRHKDSSKKKDQEQGKVKHKKDLVPMEGWSDAYVARRTGRPRTPYSVYIKGKKWKDFENDDHARAVMDKLKAKFKADGRDPETITIAPTDYDNMVEAQLDELSPQTLRSYIKKSKGHSQKYDQKGNKADEKGDKELANKMWNKGDNRYAGAEQARSKLADLKDKKKGVAEGESARDKWSKASAEREKKHDAAEKEMKARHARGEEDMKGSIDRLEKHLNNK